MSRGRARRRTAVAACVVLGAFLVYVPVAGAAPVDLLGVNPDGHGLTANPDSASTSVDDSASSVNRRTLDTIAGNAQDDLDGTLGEAKQSEDKGDSGGGDGGGGPPGPTPITAKGLNWCRWWAFGDMANEVANYASTIDVDVTLRTDLEDCVSQEFPGNISDNWVGVYLATQNELQLVMAVNNENAQAAGQDLVNGFSLPTQVWIDWFKASSSQAWNAYQSE